MQEYKTYLTAEDLIKQANADFIEYIKNGKYKEILLSMSNLNCYSLTNQILIIKQLSQAKCVNGMKVWNYNHRNIKKGEKAIHIIAPNTEKVKQDIKDENGNLIETNENEVFGYQCITSQ